MHIKYVPLSQERDGPGRNGYGPKKQELGGLRAKLDRHNHNPWGNAASKNGPAHSAHSQEHTPQHKDAEQKPKIQAKESLRNAQRN